jgi:hypothetical protein
VKSVARFPNPATEGCSPCYSPNRLLNKAVTTHYEQCIQGLGKVCKMLFTAIPRNQNTL